MEQAEIIDTFGTYQHLSCSKRTVGKEISWAIDRKARNYVICTTMIMCI